MPRRKRAKEESKSMAEIVRETVEKYLSEKEIDWENAQIFKAVGFIKGTSVSDMSINHDYYIYG